MKETKTPGQQLLMLFGISVCCMFISEVLSRLILLLYYGDQLQALDEFSPMVILVLSGIGHLIMHIAVFFIFLRITDFSFRDLFPKIPVKPPYFIFLPFIALLCIFLAGGLSGLSYSFFEAGGFSEIIEAEMNRQSQLMPLLAHTNPGQLVLSLFVFAVLPAVGEEFIYRGILQSRLAEATHNIHFAVLISALIFSAMHFQPVNLLAIAVMGIILGYIYAFTRNIWYGIMLHFLINGIQVLQVYFWPEFSV